MKESVDTRLRDQQAGFRKNRSCTDQIAALWIIVEQSIEWNSSLYINFIEYEEAFDSVDRTTLWKLLRHYGVPLKIVNIIQNSYDGLHCKIVHGGQSTKSFELKTVIDWIMNMSTSEGKHGIHWTARMKLDDLDFADALTLLSQTQQQMQEKTNNVAAASTAIDSPDKNNIESDPSLKGVTNDCNESQELVISINKSGILSTMKETFLPGICVLITLMITLSLFPAVVARIRPITVIPQDLWTSKLKMFSFLCDTILYWCVTDILFIYLNPWTLV
ncbi:unnamed protein product [Schistosoma mattheei]|uniref:Uncharacterized protein n=1 Tax=Schistosoma mattheei TaxID=31246 RepID=A0A183PG32_9TREM|nr:unnamed protein product [Schistosoma mattheei]